MASTNSDLNYDLNYFTKRQGLRGFGSALRGLQESDVSVEQIVDYLGPRFDKNGWKILPPRVTPEVQLGITNLYRRIFRRGNILNDTISLEFARGIVAEANDKKVNWAAYAVYVNSKRRNLEASRRNRSLQLGVLQKRVLPRPPPGNSAVFGDIPLVSTVFRHPLLDLGGVGEESDPTSAIITELSKGGSVFREPAPIHRSSSHSSLTLVAEGERTRSAKQSTLRSKMECTSSSKRGAKLTVRRSMSNSGTGCQNEAISKTVDRVQKLLLESQSSFLGVKDHLSALLQEKEERELVLRRARLNRDDRMSFCEDALAEVEKVKIALEQSQSYVDRWTTCTDSIDLQLSPICEDIGALSGEQLQARVSDLQQQLLVEERNVSKTQLKLQETEVEYERCLESTSACEKRYASLAKSQSYTESYLILIGQYLAKLKIGLVDFFNPTPIQRPKDFEKNTLVYVEDCPLCGEGFHCNDIVVSSCGHTYHPFCMSSHSSKSNRCIAEFCDEAFDPNWRLSFGFADNLCSGDIQSVAGTSSEGPSANREGAQHLESDQGHSSLQLQSTSSEMAKSAGESFQAAKDVVECFACKRYDDIIVSLQPCGHCGVCKKCAGVILFYPTCSGIVEGCRDPKLITPLRPLAFGDAFNSAIQPDVEMPSEKAKRQRKINTNMEIFGGREPELHSESEESSEDEETLLNTPTTTIINKPKRLCASGLAVETSEGYCSEGELRDNDDCAVEDDGNHELSQPKTSSEHQMGSNTGVNVLGTESTANATLLHEDNNTKGTPIAEKERLPHIHPQGLKLKEAPIVETSVEVLPTATVSPKE